MDALSLDISQAVEASVTPSPAQSSQRSSPRRMATYTSFLPRRTTSVPADNDTDPLICSQDRNLSSARVRAKSASAVKPTSSGTSFIHCLPVVVVVASLATAYTIFVFYHLKPAIEDDVSHLGVLSNKTVAILLSTSISCLMFLLNYILCATVDPGRVPETLDWCMYPGSEKRAPPTVCETTKSGDRRSCKWCSVYKPDRAHHCSTCGRCVLKMDHHCLWVNNCIGWANHKFFFLSVFYAVVLSGLVSTFSYPTVRHVMRNPVVPTKQYIALIVGEAISILAFVLCSIFLIFHIWLMCEAYTTLDICEKGTYSCMWLDRSIWSGTLYENISCVLGRNPLFWLLPIDDRIGDGLTFTPHITSDDTDESYDENSTFIKMARETKQFEPILDV
ncbi:DHHC zinc finger domain containing protein, putative [Babesia bigemina]|uniref:Palmitoyltransferase n=1 Tax=Babesia bigemina TaxID=5866 RepID=A0A061DEC8_BABBI|nr:DHHC zinc finger domain containing protein, putative [Babesia bigemina]CDR97055.1 DHHC zinc finger domain containing protein, putative [Babesia bigemina]|eukprot:XP_012769241.1 DHHC zinc finger domain containing protein, putative [Babesia bigemina]